MFLKINDNSDSNVRLWFEWMVAPTWLQVDCNFTKGILIQYSQIHAIYILPISLHSFCTVISIACDVIRGSNIISEITMKIWGYEKYSNVSL